MKPESRCMYTGQKLDKTVAKSTLQICQLIQVSIIETFYIKYYWKYAVYRNTRYETNLEVRHFDIIIVSLVCLLCCLEFDYHKEIIEMVK